MPIKKTEQINLLPQDDFQTSTFGRILKWTLSSFRVMVIITELIVMSAFLSRFWLDAKNSDLNESLNVKKSQVLAYSDVEKEFRSYQKKLSIIRNLYLEGKNNNLISEMVGVMPSEIVVSTIQKTDEKIQIKATGFSESAIAQFLINLESLNMFNGITLSQVASNVDNPLATTFSIDAEVKDRQGGQK